MAITFNPCDTLSWRYFISMAPQMSQKFQTSKYETCFRIPLHISNFTKMFIKNLHTPHGEKKILWTKTSSNITKQHHCNSRKYPWQRKFLDIQAQNFINKHSTQQAKFMELYIHPKHLFSSSFRIVNSYTRQLPAKKNRKKSKKKQIKIFKKAKKKPNTGYKDS